MKKFLSVLIVFIILLFCGAAFGWTVTVTWTASAGPSLTEEQCLLDEVMKCTVAAGDATQCVFTVADLTGQQVVIRSFNTQGAYADYAVGALNAEPAPATDGNIIISEVEGASVTLAWDPNSEEDLAGYKIYYGVLSRSYDKSVDVGNITQFTVEGLERGITYYFAATAYDTSDNESGFSEEVEYTVPS